MLGEPDEPADALVLRDLAWVKELARRLLGDADLATDVAHEAWLAARLRPPAHLDGGVRAWLATVVHHGVQRLRRSERRRRAREAHVAERAATVSAADVVERGALCRELCTVVMELDEPYRSAVLLRYLDGLSTEQVAARQGVAPAAARKRLSRALQSLRERLDGRHAGGFVAWSAAWRSEFIVPAPAAAASVVGASLWFMNTKYLFAAAAALAALLVSSSWWLPDDAPSPVGEPPSPRVVHAETRSAGTAPAAVAERTTPAPELVVEIVDDAGRPQHGVLVLALHRGAPVQTSTSAVDGAARFAAAVEPADELLLACPGVVPMRLARVAGPRQRVVFAHGDVIDGSVRVGDGAGDPGALRLEHDRSGGWATGLDAAALQQLVPLGITADGMRVQPAADGRFAFRGLPVPWTGALTSEGAWTLLERDGRGSRDDETTLLLLQPERDLHLELAPPFTVRGRLLADAQPAVGLRVDVVVFGGDRGGFWTAVSDADGHFAVAVPRPREGVWRGELLVGLAGDEHLLQRRVQAQASDAQLDLGVLELGREVVFAVTGRDGGPLAGAWVHVVGDGGVFLRGDTDAGGRARVFGVPPDAKWASVGAPAHRTAIVDLPAQGDVTVRLAVGNGVDVQVVDGAGLAAADLRLRVEADRMPFELPGQLPPATAQPFVQVFPLDTDGRRLLGDLAPGVLLRLVVVDAGEQEVGRTEVVTPPLGRRYAVRIVVARERFVCRGTVVDERGRPVPRARIHAEREGEALAAVTDADGRFELGPLRHALRDVHFEVRHPAFVTWLREDVALQPEPLAEVVLTRGRTVRVSVRQANGEPLDVADAWLAFDAAPTCLGRSDGGGELTFEQAAVQPGRLVARLGGRECFQPIGAGETAVVWRLPTVGTMSVTVDAAILDRDGERVCCVVTPLAPAGDVERRYRSSDAAVAGPTWQLPLLPGTYRVGLEARRFGAGGARVRQLGAVREIEIAAGDTLHLALP